MRRHFRSILVILSCLLSPCFAADGDGQQLLVLHSYHKADWTDQLNKGIESVFKARDNTEVHVEYMDTKRDKSPTYLESLAEAYAIKWRNYRPDLVLTSDDNALHFALAHRARLFAGVPIVFCGVNNYSPELLAGHDQVTGVVERGDFEPTLSWYMQQRPSSERIIVICDNTNTGRINRQNFQAVLDEHFPQLQPIECDHLTRSELAELLKDGHSADLAFFIAFWHDGQGTAVSPEQLSDIFRASAMPVLGRSEWMIDKGMLGGKCVSGFAQGQTAARLAVSVLDDKVLPAVITDSPNVFMFDYEELSRHGMAGASLPAGSLVINRPSGLIDIDRTSFILLLSTLAALLIACLALIAYAHQRRNAQRQAARSAGHLRDLLESLGDAVVVHDAESGRVLDTNGRCLEMYDCDRESFINSKPDRFCQGTPPYGPAEAMARLVAARDEQAQIFEWHARRANGALFWIEVNLRRATLDERVCVVATVRDITQRKEAEEERALLFEHSLDLLCIADHDYRFLQNNPAWTRCLGWTVEELQGERYLDFVHPDDVEATVSAAGHLAEGQSVQSFVNRYRCKDGSYRLLSWNSIVLEDRNRAFAVARDITEERRMQEELHQAQKLESVGRLAGGVAHDFNNMLTGILGAAELLDFTLSKDGNPSTRKLLDTISNSAERAAELTKQLLAVGRKSQVSLEALDLNQLVEQACAILGRTIDRRIVIDCQLNKAGAPILGDRGLIHAAVLNLGINARDAMPDGGIITFITGIIDRETIAHDKPDLPADDYVRLQVIDSGTGIDPAIRNRIFEPFFTTKAIGQGTGLGLSATYATVTDHRGHIDVESGPERGTCFSIYLPLHQPASASSDEDSGSAPLPGSGKILVVDDEMNVRNMATAMLGQLGYEVIEAVDGKQAIDIYTRQHQDIDLILMDLVMARMSGEQTFLALRDINPSLRVILNSGYDIVGGQAAALMEEPQVHGFLRKPYRLRELADCVAKALAG